MFIKLVRNSSIYLLHISQNDYFIRYTKNDFSVFLNIEICEFNIYLSLKNLKNLIILKINDIFFIFCL